VGVCVLGIRIFLGPPIVVVVVEVVGLMFLLGFMVYLGEKSIRWRSVVFFLFIVCFCSFHFSFSFRLAA
jgi:Na+-translocating ferredoxin:NAD+ oxidoreductase RnfD subunit